MDIVEKRAAHFAHLCSVFPECVARLSWTRAEIEAYQTNALRKLLRTAKAASPWHAARLQDVDPDTTTPADLFRIPPMSKSDLMEHWDDIVTIPGASRAEAETALQTMRDQFYIWGDHVLFASGGTGGRPGLFVYDWHGLALNWAGMARSIAPYLKSLPIPGEGEPLPYRTAAIGAETSAHGSFVVGRVFANPANPTRLYSGWRSVEELLPKLNDFKPQLLSCYPHLIPALAAAARAKALDIAPLVIVCGGEHFSDESRALAAQTWPGAQIMSCWGTSEAGGTFPCPYGGCHISEDQVIIEPVDARGAPVGPGERSSGIYLTTLYNHVMPTIRYFIDDEFEMAEGPCPCGSQFKKVRQVHGRSFERFRYGAIHVHPVTLQLAVLEQPQILEYQIRQTAGGAHIRYRAQRPVDEPRLVAKMIDALRSYGLVMPRVTAEAVEHLERTSVGKLKRFIPLTDRPLT